MYFLLFGINLTLGRNWHNFDFRLNCICFPISNELI